MIGVSVIADHTTGDLRSTTGTLTSPAIAVVLVADRRYRIVPLRW
jgi:hypothetical protein